MKLIYQGKTKDVYALDDGNCLFKFKDDVTGKDGVFDPGANHVGLTVAGMGQACLRLTEYYYSRFNKAGIATHYISSDFENNAMTVKNAGTVDFEVIVRFRSTGSFMRRFGMYAKEGQALDALVEFTLKDNDREDPPATKDILAALGLLDEERFELIKAQAQGISKMIRDDLASKGMELWDIKLEFGTDSEGHIMLVDEISGGNMRIYKENAIVKPLDLVELIIG